MRLGHVMLFSVLALLASCSKAPTSDSDKPRLHVDRPPHGGTVVVLGDGAYHIELVLNSATGTLQAYVLDDEMEDFVRSGAPSITINVNVAGIQRSLVLAAVANPATGETVGDTSLFEASAEWLKTTPVFDAVISSITVRGTTFTNIKFNFPRGNEAG